MGTSQSGANGKENWDNCNSIINKVYFKKKEKKNPRGFVGLEP